MALPAGSWLQVLRSRRPSRGVCMPLARSAYQAGVGCFCALRVLLRAPAWGGGGTAPSSSAPPLHCPAPLFNTTPLIGPPLALAHSWADRNLPSPGTPVVFLSGSWHPWRGGRRRSGGVGVTSRALARWKGPELSLSSTFSAGILRVPGSVLGCVWAYRGC